MGVFLHGLKLQFYRGIGDQTQTMYPFKRFNFFIGTNNSGKSTILNFISKHLSDYPGREGARANQLDSLEVHLGTSQGTLSACIALPLAEFLETVRTGVPDRKANPHRDLDLKDVITRLVAHFGEGDALWVKTPIPPPRGAFSAASFEFEKPIDAQIGRSVLSPQEWQSLWSFLRGVGGGGYEQHWFPETMQALRSRTSVSLPQAGLIPAIRQIGPKDQDYSDLSGQGLGSKLITNS